MAVLTFRDRRGRKKRAALRADRPFVIGRGFWSDLRPSDPSVSRKHCVVAFHGAVWTVEDLGSADGTFVNGERTTGKAALTDGDELACAGFMLEFFAVAPPADEPDEPPVPDVGKRVDERRIVRLASAVEGPRLTLCSAAVSIVLSRTHLERLATERPREWKTERQRMALIAGGRAETVLESAGAADAIELSLLDQEGLYLVVDLIRAGRALIQLAGAPAPAVEATVRYRGDHRDESFGMGIIDVTVGAVHVCSVEWFVA